LAASAVWMSARVLALTVAPASRLLTMRTSAMSTLKIGHAGGFQAFKRQLLGFQVGLQPGVAVDFGAELQRLTGGVGAVGAGVQHGAAIAKAGHAVAVEQVGVNAGHLGGGVGAQAQGAAGKLVDQLESLQIQRFAGAGQERLKVLQQWRHDEFIAVAAGGVQEQAAQLFDVARLGGQDIGNLIGQLP
jgi:hypothetical protein